MPELNELDWRGLDLSQEADNIPPGFCQVADNLSLDGIDLITRPGLTAILTSAHTSGIYAYTPIVSAMGSEKGIYAADSGLYYWAGSTSASAVTGAGTVAHAAAQVALLPGAAFVVDGAADLKRVSLDSSGVPGTSATITELNRPTAPTVEPYASVLNALAAASLDVDTVSACNTNLCGNPRFNGGDSTGSNLGNYWKVVAGTPKCYSNADAGLGALPSLSTGDRWLRLDDAGDVVLLDFNSTAGTHSYVSNGYAYNAKWSSDSSKYRYAKRFVFKCRAVKIGSTAKPFLVRLKFYDSAATPTDSVTPLYQTEQTLTVSADSADQFVRFTVDLTDTIALDVRYVRVYLLPDPTSTVTNDGPYVTDVDFQAVHPQWKRISGTQGFMPDGQDDGATLKGLYIASDLSSATVNATGRNTLGLTLTVPATFSPVPSVVVQFGNAGGEVWTSPYTDFGSGISVDITEMPVSIKSAITKVALVFQDDSTITGIAKVKGRSVPTSDNCAFFLTSLTEPGNLLESRDYWYALVEVDDAGDSTLLNVIHSDGSAPTSAVTTTGAQRQIKLTLPARTNSGAEYLALYRFGGSFLPQPGDPALPTGRLLCWIAWNTATFSAGGDVQKPTSPASGYPVVFANPYLTWTKTGSTGDAGSLLIDNTPDSWLTGADTYSFGREKAPTAPESIGAWDNRLWLAKGADLYASWDIPPGRDAGIYWTRTAESVDTDPEAPKKGWWVRLRLTPGDTIKRILPLGENAPSLLVLSRYSAFAVTRSGARAFDRRNATGGDLYTVTELKGDDIGGVVGSQAACVFDQSAYWLSDRGLLRWHGGAVENVGDKVRRLLPGVPPSMTYHASALPKCALIAHPHFLYVSTPSTAATTAPDTALVWHAREKGWTRWLKGFQSGSGDILGGQDGQLWRVGGSGDKSTPNASAAGVAISLTGREMNDGLMVFNPGRLFYSVALPGATNGTLSFNLQGDGSANTAVTQTVLGTVSNRVRLSRSMAGRRHVLSMTTTTIERLRIRGLGVDLIPTTRRRV